MILTKVDTIQKLVKAVLTVFLMFIAIFSASSAFAIEVNVAMMLKNFAQTVPNMMRLVTAIAYVMGMFFIVKGLFGLKHYGDTRTQMSSHQELTKPLLAMLVGAVLLYLPASIQVGIGTFWQNTSPLAYEPETQDNWTDFMQNVFMILQLIGTFAFIRGVIMMTHIGGHGGREGTFSRALTHMIGGIFLINMYQFIQTVVNTLSLGQI